MNQIVFWHNGMKLIEYPGWNNYSLSAWIAENIPTESFSLRETQCSKEMSPEKALHLHPHLWLSKSKAGSLHYFNPTKMRKEAT